MQDISSLASFENHLSLFLPRLVMDLSRLVSRTLEVGTMSLALGSPWQMGWGQHLTLSLRSTKML